MNQADTAWMLISTALVLLMTPALAFFYGGLVPLEECPQHHDDEFHLSGVCRRSLAVLGYSSAFSVRNNWIGDLSNVAPKLPPTVRARRRRQAAARAAARPPQRARRAPRAEAARQPQRRAVVQAAARLHRPKQLAARPKAPVAAAVRPRRRHRRPAERHPVPPLRQPAAARTRRRPRPLHPRLLRASEAQAVRRKLRVA